jgi:hypothetical protein
MITVALHAMYDTVHRALINRYTHTSRTYYVYTVVGMISFGGGILTIRLIK